MERGSIMSRIIINLFITAVAYLAYPAICCLSKKEFLEKQIKKRVVINGIIVFLVFTFMGGGNATAALLWSCIAYWIMSEFCLVKPTK